MNNIIISDYHKISLSDINDIILKLKNMQIYFSRVNDFLNTLLSDLKCTKKTLEERRNCFNSIENSLQDYGSHINEFINNLNNNNSLSNYLFDYKFTRNILPFNTENKQYFEGDNLTDIHRYRNKFFLELIFNCRFNYLFSSPLITLNFDEKNLYLTLNIRRKYTNITKDNCFDITKHYKYIQSDSYAENFDHNLEYLNSIIENLESNNIQDYISKILNEIEAIKNICDIILIMIMMLVNFNICHIYIIYPKS